MRCRAALRAQVAGNISRLAQRRSISSNAVIFSGIQPTGVPHLGNYLGALKQWVQFQETAAPDAKILYSIVDLHAITVPQQAERLKQWKRETLAALLAIGLAPERSVIFYQSSVPAHSELMWILSCTASMGYLSRMTQWKVGSLALPDGGSLADKLKQSKLHLSQDTSFLDEKAKSSLKLGLFSYPVLQAADILVHRATHVPVGDDQQQHLEFARECATNFNHVYGQHLIPPDTILSPARRVMSLQQPTQKMSKSHADPRSRILLTDNPEEIHKKVMSALTDSANSVSYDPKARPGVSNLLEILSIFNEDGKTPDELADALAGANLRDLKMKVSDAVVSSIGGIRERYLELLARDGGRYLDHVETLGALKARASAEETMDVVRSAVGL